MKLEEGLQTKGLLSNGPQAQVMEFFGDCGYHFQNAGREIIQYKKALFLNRHVNLQLFYEWQVELTQMYTI